MKKIVLSFCLLLTSVFVYSAENLSDPTSLLQKKLSAMQSYKAKFSQTVIAGRRVIQRSKGSMAIQKPGKFRWYSVAPMKQLIIADGKHLWIYDEELEQVTVKPQKNGLGGTPALFLSGYDDSVKREFSVSMKSNKSLQTYTLLPKTNKGSFQKVILIYNKDKLVAIELLDKLDQLTKVKFKKIQNNPTLKLSLFQFKPPKGVDVIREGD